jgi:adenylylsulfate kinase
MSKDIRIRSIIKKISWGVLATLTTVILVYIFTGKLKIAAGVGVVDVILKTIFYYGHERLWSKVLWGEVKSV